MLQYAMTGKHPAPMPARDNPWAVYDVFTVKDGEQIFLAAVSDAQWQVFCRVLGFDDLAADAALATNNQRVLARPALLAALRERLAARTAAELATVFEDAGLPFAPIRRPEDLYDDPHLNATGGLAEVEVADGDKAGQKVKTTLLPITLRGQRLGVRLQPPKMGEHTDALLQALGYNSEQIAALRRQAVVA
jgi:crotonobetainyl-CoA:carnitine CoA-transferase CaiB-like acyl-CoA transferase